MQIALACKIAKVPQEVPKCNHESLDTTNWNVVIDQVKDQNGKEGIGDPEVLLNNLEKVGYSAPEYPSRISGLADLFDCKPAKFPCQTHHLIPEKQLPKLPISGWLAKNPLSECKLKDYKLLGDTNYDTNGAKNGYFMPFAATTYQWKYAEKNKELQNRICFEMMRLTKIQLHQGPHSKSKHYVDFGEDPDSEEYMPYKKQVELYLDEVYRQIITHVKGCDDCNKNNKNEIPPLESTVTMVEQVSHLLKVLCERGEIVVSGRAGAYRNVYAKERKGYNHPKEPFVTKDEFK